VAFCPCIDLTPETTCAYDYQFFHIRLNQKPSTTK